MLIKRYKKLDMKRKAFIAYIAMFILCVMVSLTGNFIAKLYIDKNYTGSEAAKKYAERINNKIYSMIAGKKIENNDKGKELLYELNKEYPDTFFSVYMWANGGTVYEPFYSSGTYMDIASVMEPLAISDMKFPEFSDGTSCTTDVTVLPSRLEKFNVYRHTISIIAGVILYVICIIIYTTRIYKKISEIKKDVDKISGGVLADVVYSGDDELGSIAGAVNNLKNDMLASRENESKALEDRNNMARNLAHDIRTPLTVISGNLELIQLGLLNGADKEIMLKNIELCKEKIEMIKQLTSNIFISEDFEVFSINQLLEIHFESYFEELKNSGFKIEVNGISGINADDKVMVRIKSNQFRRVLENVFSNIMKYADTGSPVKIICRDNSIIVGNAFKIKSKEEDYSLNDIEHNYIGKNACIDIMKDMNGNFSCWVENETYFVKMEFQVM